MLESMRQDTNVFVRNNRQYGSNLSLRLEKLNLGIDEPNLSEIKQKEAALGVMQNFKMSASANAAYSYSLKSWEKAVKALKDTEVFYIKSTTKVLLGTGNASVFEFGFNLQKPFGTPYISGSSLKGIVSSYLAENGGDDWWRSNRNTEKSQSQVQLFGGRYDKADYIGSVNFYDARIAPGTQNWFVNDIITTHHKQYYGGGRLPDGTENPIPIKIAALDSGLRFLVVLQGPERDRKFIKEVLLKALEYDGIGGKTAVGYGRFEYIKTENEILDEIRNSDVDSLISFAKKGEKLGKDPQFDDAIREGVNNNELTEKLENVYKKFSPLKYIRLQIKQKNVSSIKDLDSLEKEVRKSLREFPLTKSDEDGRYVFDFALQNFELSSETITTSRLLNLIAYDWADVGITADNIDKIVTDILDQKRLWPDKASLIKWIENSALENKEIYLELLKM